MESYWNNWISLAKNLPSNCKYDCILSGWLLARISCKLALTWCLKSKSVYSRSLYTFVGSQTLDSKSWLSLNGRLSCLLPESPWPCCWPLGTWEKPMRPEMRVWSPAVPLRWLGCPGESQRWWDGRTQPGDEREVKTSDRLLHCHLPHTNISPFQKNTTGVFTLQLLVWVRLRLH